MNAVLNQNYFQFHGSHYKYENGVPLGLPISRSLFKNLLQNLEGKFIKCSSKSKALIYYTTGVQEVTVHLTSLFYHTCILWICVGTLTVLTELDTSSHPL
jgi:hypothetical protein